MEMFTQICRLVDLYCQAKPQSASRSTPEKLAFVQTSTVLLNTWRTNASGAEQAQALAWFNSQERPNIYMSVWCFAQQKTSTDTIWANAWPTDVLVQQIFSPHIPKDLLGDVLQRMHLACVHNDVAFFRHWEQETPNPNFNERQGRLIRRLMLDHGLDNRVLDLLVHMHQHAPKAYAKLLKKCPDEYITTHQHTLPNINGIVAQKNLLRFFASCPTNATHAQQWLDVLHANLPHVDALLDNDVTAHIRSFWRSNIDGMSFAESDQRALVALFAQYTPHQMHAVLPHLFDVQEEQHVPHWLLDAWATHHPSKVEQHVSSLVHVMFKSLGNMPYKDDLQSWKQCWQHLHASPATSAIIRNMPLVLEVPEMLESHKHWWRTLHNNVSAHNIDVVFAWMQEYLPQGATTALGMMLRFDGRHYVPPASTSTQFSTMHKMAYAQDVRTTTEEFMFFVQKCALKNAIPQSSSSTPPTPRKI